MIRRILCLGVLLLSIVLGVTACGGTITKSQPTYPASDTDPPAKPKPAGGKAG
jgi:hypothetical protein